MVNNVNILCTSGYVLFGAQSKFSPVTWAFINRKNASEKGNYNTLWSGNDDKQGTYNHGSYHNTHNKVCYITTFAIG